MIESDKKTMDIILIMNETELQSGFFFYYDEEYLGSFTF